MPTYANDPRNKPITEDDLDEAVNFWEDVMAECEYEEDAADCYRIEPKPEPDKVLEATLAKDAA